MRRPQAIGMVLACAAALTACSQARSVPAEELLAPYALERETVDGELAQQAAATGASIYIAAPMLTSGTQAVIELSGDLEPLTLVDVSGASVGALTETAGELAFIDRSCISDNGGYTFCSRTGVVTTDGATVDEATGELDLDSHALAYDADGQGFWGVRYASTPCDDSVHACTLAPEDEPLDFVYDCHVVHVRDGEAVWEWSALEHTDPSLLDTAATTEIYNAVDPFHCNSVQPDEDAGAVYVSMRHPSSVLAVDIGSGDVRWTFGVDRSPAALAVDDPDGLLGERQVLSGNHDFRWLGGTRYSVFDNGSGGVGPARAIVFSVADGTATIENVIEDPAGVSSRCTGSARPLDEDEAFWVIDWGCSASGVSVMTAEGVPVAHLSLDYERAVEMDLLMDTAADQPDVGSTVTYHALVAAPGLLAP
ncbi:aryl-sulfate sulfotransferase [Demequina gelatinilytica]|uniref:aryl-sulfate sulfotransferase n=1 Tax=Demequina gelatinilytica TaxID=1638980 RepID=UPI0014703D23|nr:aryl-sulfate sulfotransferase [Demequina gelatinilytica]